MLIYGMEFYDGMIFQKKDSYELLSSVCDLAFGKLVQARARGSGIIEVFNAKLPNAEIFADSCVATDDLLIGFLSHRNGKITIRKQGDLYTGFVDHLENCSEFEDLDPFVVLQGYNREFLFKEYVRLVAHQNNVVFVPKPYLVFVTGYDKIEDSIKKAKEANFEVLLVTQQENLDQFVRVCRINQLIPGIVVEFDEVKLKELKKKGFEFFEVIFAQDEREDVQLARNILEDSIFIAKGVSPLTGVGLVDGLILEKCDDMKELLKLAVMQKFVRFYVNLNQTDEKVLNLCVILNLGIICDWCLEKIEYTKFYKIERIDDQDFIISYLDRNNILRRLYFTGQTCHAQIKSASYLKREKKIRSDGRSFYFYREG